MSTYEMNKYRQLVPEHTKLTPQRVLDIFGVTDKPLREAFLNIVQKNCTTNVFGLSDDSVECTMNLSNLLVKYIDVYDVLKGFNILNPAEQHAVKKILMCGLRGHKDKETDLMEIISALSRA
jgi:hypothetical protein